MSTPVLLGVKPFGGWVAHIQRNSPIEVEGGTPLAAIESLYAHVLSILETEERAAESNLAEAAKAVADLKGETE